MDQGIAEQMTVPSPPRPAGRLKAWMQTLGPGLVTGAADDDPSGIATYNQIGAQFGYAMGWTMSLTFPLMAAIQEVAARIGSVTGRGLAANLRHHYPKWVLVVALSLLAVANIVNLGADIAAMGDSMRLLLGGDGRWWALMFGMLCIGLEILVPYRRYAGVLKWLCLSLLAYVASAVIAHVEWGRALSDLLLPTLPHDSSHAMALVAVLGTTISPYLFFWQSSQEVEDGQRRGVKALAVAPSKAGPELRRIRLDTLCGMGISNLIAWFIMLTAAATLHAAGITNITTTSDAVQALRPLAGRFAAGIFAAGVVGTGLLAVPVLAGSIAYAVGEALRWTVGLEHKWGEAKPFYRVIAIASLMGVAMDPLGIDPVRALIWSAVLNGVLAAPLMALMMVMGSNPKVMGHLTLPPVLRLIGWLATAVMAVASLAIVLLPS